MFDPLDHTTPPEDMEALGQIVKVMARTLRVRPRIVEVGSWVGGTAIAMADAGADVFCVDHLLGNQCDRLGQLAHTHGQAKVLRTLLSNLGDRAFRTVHPCVGTSAVWAEAWPKSLLLDAVFIDADHRYEFVRRDIEAWKFHVRPGGVIMGHDYGVFPGVNSAADELAAELGQTVRRHGRCVWSVGWCNVFRP